jgi:hypothetical protein
MFRPNLTTSTIQNIPQIVRILPPLQHLDRSRNNAADYSKSKKGLSPWTV